MANERVEFGRITTSIEGSVKELLDRIRAVRKVRRVVMVELDGNAVVFKAVVPKSTKAKP